MTPEQIKRRYREMLNNEIFLNDPIAWMSEGREFVVLTTVTSYKCCGAYGNVALCEVEKGVTPKMISQRAKGMRFIWELHTNLRKRDRPPWRQSRQHKHYETILAEVTARCAELNAEVARLDALHAKNGTPT
jgi:hypothetical protein